MSHKPSNSSWNTVPSCARTESVPI
jgi:hypothetical protein